MLDIPQRPIPRDLLGCVGASATSLLTFRRSQERSRLAHLLPDEATAPELIGRVVGPLAWIVHDRVRKNLTRMRAQLDYEAEITLAVFRSAEAAATAEREVGAAGIQFSRERLARGRYQVADRRLTRHASAVMHVAAVGAVFGAAERSLVASSVSNGVRVTTQDVASSVDVDEATEAILIRTWTSVADKGSREVRRTLDRSCAVTYLDATAWEARQQSIIGAVIIDSTDMVCGGARALVAEHE